MRDKFRELYAHVTSPHSPRNKHWQGLQNVFPVHVIAKRAADHLIRSGDEHKRCAFGDLYAARQSVSGDIFDFLDAEHSQ